MTKLTQIQVLKAGLHDTFQDLGRAGFRHLGIPVSGAMDIWSHQLANGLVGNPNDFPTLEIVLKGGEYLFLNEAVIAITGGDFQPKINGKRIDNYQSYQVETGDVLKLGFAKSGSKAYLAVQGLADIQQHFKSYSTYTYGKFGGHEGRILKKNDEITIRNDNFKFEKKRVPEHLLPQFKALTIIRVLKSPEWNWLAKNSQQQLFEQEFTVSNDSNRMGIRLLSEPLTPIVKEKMLSSGTAVGTLQLLPNGQLVALMNDGQTTGGYPRIANVITADLGRLSQVPPNGKVKFRWVDEANALAVLNYKQQKRMY